MVDPVAVVQCIGDTVARPVINASKKQIDYVRKYDDYIKDVQELHHLLENQREEIGQNVERGNEKNEKTVPEVEDWLKGVGDFLSSKDENWEELLSRDEEARKKAEKCCFGHCWSPVYRLNLSKKAEKKANDIRVWIEKMRKRGEAPVTIRTKPPKLGSAAAYFCGGLESRETTLKAILDVLRTDKVNRIGIHGMGGAGKTTLVQELARRAESEKLFNAIVIAEISQFPDFKRIQDQIADRIGLSCLDDYHNVDERAIRLGNRFIQIVRGKRIDDNEQHGPTKGEKPGDEKGQTKTLNKLWSNKLGGADEKGHNKEKIEGNEKEGRAQEKPHDDDEKEGRAQKKPHGDDEKEGRAKGKKSGDDEKQGRAEKSGKLLVILDNIWKKFDLRLVGIPYELEKDLGCKVIVTSRSKDVCRAMDAIDSRIFKVGDLNDDEAEHLFRGRVGNIVDDKDYKEISKQLLRKCSRLPLSINVLADTLKNQTLSVWERILRQLEKPVQAETLGVLSDTYSIIEMSYKYLGCKEKKMFFLLCCLFPPGSSVCIDVLMRYGIGLGLFEYVNSIVEAIEQAHQWADDLKSLSLLSDVDVQKGEISIHDDVREAGKTFAAKGKHVFHVGALPRWLKRQSYKKYTAVSMKSDGNYEYLAGRPLPNLELLRSHGSCVSKLHQDFFRGMINLKVLDLSESNIETIPSSMVHLKCLETLLLDYCSLKDISQISKLVKLQVLSFRESNITRLPEDIRDLVELKLLDLTNCDKLNVIPAGVFVNLTQLEGLYMKHSFSDWSIGGSMASLSELRSLPLHVLEIKIQSFKQLPEGNFPVLDLSSYKIEVEVSTPQQDTLSPRDLQVGEVQARELIKEGWKPLMSKAESLFLKNIQGLKNVAPYLGEYGLRELKRIKVSDCSGMECFIGRTAVCESVLFPKLKILCLEYLDHLVAIYHGKSPPNLFADLQQLTLSYLNGLQSFAISIQHATRLRVLEVKSCENLEFIFSAPASIQFQGREEANENQEILLPCLEKLILANLTALRGLCVETNVDDTNRHLLFKKMIIFPSLDKMKLKRLREIDELWDMTKGEEFARTFPKLRSISLKDMPKLSHVWSGELRKGSFSFMKFKKLKIWGCDSLNSVCPLSVASGFRELELLRVHSCDELKQVISTEGRGEGGIISKQIKFHKLLTLDFMQLGNLTCFYQGRVRMEFPVLKSLKLDTLPKMETLAKVADSKKAPREREHLKDGVLFNKEVEFPCLEQLYAESLDSIQGLWGVRAQEFSTKFPKLKTLSLQYMEKLKNVWSKEFSGASPSIISLKDIEIDSCDSLESLFPPSATSNTLAEVNFDDLQTLKLVSSKSFKYFLQGNVNLIFPVLKELELTDLDVMKKFAELQNLDALRGREIDNEDPLVPLFNQKIFFPSLEKLQLETLPKVEKLWDMTNSEEFTLRFPRLKTLRIIDLPKPRYVWSDELSKESQYFGSLEVMAIISCGDLEGLFSPTGSYSSPQTQFRKGISFPKLQMLVLAKLKSFRCLFQGYSNMEFEALKELIVWSLPMIKSLVKLEKCKTEMGTDTNTDEKQPSHEDDEPDKEEDGLRIDPVLFKGNVEFFSLEELTIGYMPELEHIYEIEEEAAVASSFIFPKLKTLDLTGGDDIKLKQLPEGILHKLSSLVISEFNTLRCLVSSANVSVEGALLRSLSELGKLKKLTIEDCDSLEKLFEVEGQDMTSLPSLCTLELSGLAKLKQIQWHVLPNLRSLNVTKSLRGKEFLIPATSVAQGLSLQSLESMMIKECPDMEAIIGMDEFQEGCEIVFPQLKDVKLERMLSIRTFNSASYTTRFPSLVSVYIIECGLIRSFSSRPVVTPKLSEFQVDDEPKPIDGELNTILRGLFDSTNKVAKCWPQKLKHKLHEEHELRLMKFRNYSCDRCKEPGMTYSYTCFSCDFDLHPQCALDESQLLEEHDEMEVGKD